MPPKAGYSVADIESVLARYAELIDASSADLDILCRQISESEFEPMNGGLGSGLVGHCHSIQFAIA
jgi:CBS domain-containing membrane protein